MTPQEFVAKWQSVTLSERSACQQHFLDICDLLEQPKPATADPQGAWYTFERGVKKTGGGDGWADVWMRGHFGWEYKGKKKDLKAAYEQLLLYRESLDNPPLLVVCDLNRFEIHTNFTSTAKKVYTFDLEGLAAPENLDVLRRVFTAPESLRPGQTSEGITKQAAELFGQLADGMRVRGIPAPDAAHFLMKLMFCMFAEDIDLLPGKLFSRLLTGAKKEPARLSKLLADLFQAMCNGGNFGADEILYFNGGLFDDAKAIELRATEIETLGTLAGFDWSAVEPSIFGTLFERTLDPAKRSQIGAHYTSREDIETLVKPVVMQPLRREWEEVQSECDKLTTEIAASKSPAVKKKKIKQRDKALRDFVERLAHVTILDPACGSGNFLYVALNLLLDLEKEVISYGASYVGLLPQVRPMQLHGIEINPYAQQLAQVVIWIGFLQWMRDNGFTPPRNPVLEPIESIRRMDAILDLTDPDNPKEPEWPAADFIVGNPPFLGGKMLRMNLGDKYVDAVFQVWDGRVPRESDLCCYWFEKSRRQIEDTKCNRAGLLATQGIRGGANVKVLQRVSESGCIFFAIRDRDWVLDGANVHVSLVGFDDGRENQRSLDGTHCTAISADLTAGLGLISAQRLPENDDMSFMGITPAGAFDIDFELGVKMLCAPNACGRSNSDVIRPYQNGKDLNQRQRHQWTIDFGINGTLDWAAGYEQPFEYVNSVVRPVRETNNRETYRKKWWLYAETRPAMRTALSLHQRYVATCMVAKHRILTWLPIVCLPANVVIVFSQSDDYFLGILHSHIHYVWAYARGTQLREKESGDRYTPTTCFETFPFPKPTGDQREAIAVAAKELDRLRSNWLNPPEWTRQDVLEFPGSKSGPWARYVHEPDLLGIGTVRYPRLVPKDEDCAKELKQRTLTNLYNKRPTWLDLTHKQLDAAVFAAYGWDPAMSDDDLLAALLALNLKRAKEGLDG
ncbi:MAG: class I SAM-dependent DNA methyltransferase [Planctomycetota bacterium]|nr:class I SAM-dependent DNA methyltransferase [Planctomycetota bacterium]